MTDRDDNLDFAIFFLSVVGLVGFIAVEIGEYVAMQNRVYCAASLSDGRALTRVTMDKSGSHTECGYSITTGKWRKA